MVIREVTLSGEVSKRGP